MNKSSRNGLCEYGNLIILLESNKGEYKFSCGGNISRMEKNMDYVWAYWKNTWGKEEVIIYSRGYSPGSWIKWDYVNRIEQKCDRVRVKWRWGTFRFRRKWLMSRSGIVQRIPYTATASSIHSQELSGKYKQTRSSEAARNCEKRPWILPTSRPISLYSVGTWYAVKSYYTGSTALLSVQNSRATDFCRS